MDERSDVEEVMLPGFRFHPTDEELVGFYLKRKIQQRPLSIELIKHLDIYKYDPWDLPKLATTGEKEWYFYCPRDRKYRNSTRPNRVTGAGFWKATGTDRPIYSSEGTKCIGLKKSLVFYQGRAAKGSKTDWMMHEFRLPSLSDLSPTPKKSIDKNLPPNDSWAICRIFKKTNSMTQRALSHSWVSPSAEITSSDATATKGSFFGNSENIWCSNEAGSSNQIYCNDFRQSSMIFPQQNFPSYKPINPPISTTQIPGGFMFSPPQMSVSSKPGANATPITPMLLNMSPSMLCDVEKCSKTIGFDTQQQQQNDDIFDATFQHEIKRIMDNGEEDETCLAKKSDTSLEHSQWGAVRPLHFPFNLTSDLSDAWNPSLGWDSSPPCPSEMSTSYSTNTT